MRRPHLLAVLALSLVVVAALLLNGSGHPALAAGTRIRSFVASTGSDANPCTPLSPRRTFATALAATASGGEVVALDTGGFGTLTISQAITITAVPGAEAFIAPSSGAAITVACSGSQNASAAYGACVLRYSAAPIPAMAAADEQAHRNVNAKISFRCSDSFLKS